MRPATSTALVIRRPGSTTSLIRGKFVPTNETLSLLPVVERLLSSHGDVNERIKDLRSGRRGLIKIATAPSLTSGLLADAIGRFRARRPNVELKISALSTKDVVARVANNDVEIGFCQPSSGDAAVTAQLLSLGSVICAFHRDHHFKDLETVSPADLVGEDIITFPATEPSGARISEAFANAGVRLRRAIEVNQSYAALSFAHMRLGVAIADSYIDMHRSFPELIGKPFSPEITIRVHMLVSSIKRISPTAEEFKNIILDASTSRAAKMS